MKNILSILTVMSVLWNSSASTEMDCWYKGEYCSIDGYTSKNDVESVGKCQNLCKESASCLEFTMINSTTEVASQCYLFESACERIIGDPCVWSGCCISGPSECVGNSLKNCTKFASNAAKSWQCTDQNGTSINALSDQIPAGSTCFIR